MERNGMCVRVRVYLTAVETNVRLLLRRGLWRSFCLLPCTSVLSSLSPGNSESTGACGAGLHAQRAWRTHTETQTRAEGRRRGEGGVRVEGLWPTFFAADRRNNKRCLVARCQEPPSLGHGAGRNLFLRACPFWSRRMSFPATMRTASASSADVQWSISSQIIDSLRQTNGDDEKTGICCCSPWQ
ncbi:hypothetical protein TcCL_Unassigned04593 [Trypanosoma cruzi]|nr:hypothetical protein TcCL_Unassigned04593 [Trypanosoma cruzi]